MVNKKYVVVNGRAYSGTTGLPMDDIKVDPAKLQLRKKFHSLEDRMVKEKFREYENPCSCPPKIPVCMCNKKSLGKVITRKPITAKESELNENNRTHSAKLRIFERKENR